MFSANTNRGRLAGSETSNIKSIDESSLTVKFISCATGVQLEPSPSQTPQISTTFKSQSHAHSGIPLPPQIPHSSSIFPKQSQSPSGISEQPQSYIAPGPSHIPQTSSTAAPFGVPAQSAQLELSPPHKPHKSYSESPPQTPAQSCWQSFVTSASHTPHSST